MFILYVDRAKPAHDRDACLLYVQGKNDLKMCDLFSRAAHTQTQRDFAASTMQVQMGSIKGEIEQGTSV